MSNNNLEILLVEDDVITMEYLKGILKSLGFKNIYESKSSDEAFKVLKKSNIELIFMDINIHGSIDGIRLATLINKDNSIPIIYTTAYVDPKTIDEASQTNIYGYLIKPFFQSSVDATLKIALKNISLHNDLKTIEDEDKSLIYLEDKIIYDLKNKILYEDTTPIKLTKREYLLLDVFCQNCNQVVLYDILKARVWEDRTISHSTIRDAVSRLKKKVPQLTIENISSLGYALRVKT